MISQRFEVIVNNTSVWRMTARSSVRVCCHLTPNEIPADFGANALTKIHLARRITSIMS